MSNKKGYVTMEHAKTHENTDEVIIMVTERDISLLKIGIKYIKRNINAARYICIGKKNLERIVKDELECEFIDENKLMEGLTYEKIRQLLKDRGDSGKRTGWYFKQLLNFAYSYYTNASYYIAWDADTIPLHPISFYDGDAPVFMIKKEYHKPYFDSIDRLFEGKVTRYREDISFIAENMLFCTQVVKQMLSDIESNKSLEGKTFYEKIINSINDKDLSASGFAEYETYGNYAVTVYSDMYHLIKRKACRVGLQLVGLKPKEKLLSWVGEYYDIVSIENHANSKKGELWLSWLSVLFKCGLIRKVIGPNRAAHMAVAVNSFQAKLIGLGPSVDYDVD